MIRALLAIAFGLVLSGCALAQSTLLQGGPWVAGRAPMYTSSGSSQPVVQDSGPAGGGAVGLGMSEGLYVARGTGVPPFVGQGTGPLGTNWCDYDAPITNATGYHYLCLSANVGSAGLIAYGSGGAASQQPLRMNVNGTNYDFPFVIGGIVGPSTTVIGDIATWANTTGTLLVDTAQIALTHLASIADQTCLGNVSGVSAAPSALTKAQCTTLINSFTSLLSGSVPASGGGTANYLRADATWAPVVANPTGTIGLATVNGSSSIAIRSDGAPALSQAIAPTWTGVHQFSNSTTPMRFPNFGAGTISTDASGNVKASAGCYAIEAFGGSGNGVVDNLTAWTAAETAIGSNSGCISFGSGVYNFSAQLVTTIAAGKSITIRGAGSGATVWAFGATNGLVLVPLGNTSSAHVSGITFTTTSSGAFAAIIASQQSACNIGIFQAPNWSFDDLGFQGSDGQDTTKYWGVGVTETNLDDINFTGLNYDGGSSHLGNGVLLQGSDAFAPCGGGAEFSVVLNFVNCMFGNFNTGIVYGTRVQGVAITQSNFTTGNIGVDVPSGALALDQLYIGGSQFGLLNYAVKEDAQLNGTSIIGNTIIIGAGQIGAQLTTASSQVVGNSFAGTGASTNAGVLCKSGSFGNIITGNAFSDLAFGINLLSGCNTNNIQSNIYRTNTANTADAGAGNVIGGGSP